MLDIENRLLAINSNRDKANEMRDMIYDLFTSRKPTLLVASGSSKVVAYYLQLLLGDEMICEVIEPRDYFYRYDISKFSNLVVITSDIDKNRFREILNSFKGLKYLVCKEMIKEEYNVVSWGDNIKEELIDMSLGPITMMLDITGFGSFRLGITDKDIYLVNEEVKELLKKSNDNITNLFYSFKNNNIIQIISGFETICSCKLLESYLIEYGLCIPIIHDKGELCNGRYNILSKEFPIIYLAHSYNDLDKIIIDILEREYQNILCFNTMDVNLNGLCWEEYYLLLQMSYLVDKIKNDKKYIDKPLVKTLFDNKY